MLRNQNFGEILQHLILTREHYSRAADSWRSSIDSTSNLGFFLQIYCSHLRIYIKNKEISFAKSLINNLKQVTDFYSKDNQSAMTSVITNQLDLKKVVDNLYSKTILNGGLEEAYYNPAKQYSLEQMVTDIEREKSFLKEGRITPLQEVLKSDILKCADIINVIQYNRNALYQSNDLSVANSLIKNIKYAINQEPFSTKAISSWGQVPEYFYSLKAYCENNDRYYLSQEDNRYIINCIDSILTPIASCYGLTIDSNGTWSSFV